jgi:hypothetical protein
LSSSNGLVVSMAVGESPAFATYSEGGGLCPLFAEPGLKRPAFPATKQACASGPSSS